MRFIAYLQSCRDVTADALTAGATAAVLSGLPSGSLALRHHQLPAYAHDAVAAAAAVVGVNDDRRVVTRWLAAGVAHGALSLGWAAVMAVGLPRRHTIAWGVAAGAAIAAIDLGVVGRRIPAVRNLATAPQVLDHLAFGAVAATVIVARRSRRRRPRSLSPNRPTAFGNPA